MYTNHDKFLAALALARANNDATAMETAKEALAAGRANKEHWAFEYELVRGGFTPPSKRIREVKFLNPATSDCRTWTEEDVFSDLIKRGLTGRPVPEYVEHPEQAAVDWIFNNTTAHENVRKAIFEYARFLAEVEPAPDRISGVYMMFQRDMSEGFCVKIGASDDCAARQSQYFTHNPFAIKGECMPCDNPKEMEKRFHEWFHTMGYENIKTSREWFAIDKGLYKALKNDGFDAIMCQWEE